MAIWYLVTWPNGFQDSFSEEVYELYKFRYATMPSLTSDSQKFFEALMAAEKVEVEEDENDAS